MSLRQSVALLKGCQKIAIGLMVLHAIGVLVVWVWALSRPHMVEPIEIRVANLIALWREGYLPYGFADRLPAVWNPYGFVYEWLCSLRWGTLHPYWNGRLLSIMAAMLTALCLLLWSHQQTGSIKGGVVATLLLLTAKPIFAFGHLCRVDMLGVALSMLGFVWVMGGRCGLKIGLGILMDGVGIPCEGDFCSGARRLLLSLLAKPAAQGDGNRTSLGRRSPWRTCLAAMVDKGRLPVSSAIGEHPKPMDKAYRHAYPSLDFFAVLDAGASLFLSFSAQTLKRS
jgi:hypothetical protein